LKMFIEINRLNFKYKGAEEDTLKDFSINIAKGEIVSILGESGSGKSTVLRLIAGLEIPKSGVIKIDSKIVLDENTFVLPEKRGIGMVFQDYALFPHLTVEENIKFGLKSYQKHEKKNRLKEMLELVNLVNYQKRYPHELSGGQQQRVALARALAPNPSLLLLDEPFSNLDKELQNKIRDDLKEIIKQTGITSIFVTHDRDDSKALADRVVILNRGMVTGIGSPQDLL